VDQAVRNSIAAGISYAIAAGNGDRRGRQQDACLSSPARVTEAMTVGATAQSDSKTSWSNYGNCVDWFAPGLYITSSWIGSNSATNTISGTSMAAPHVAGVAALYLQANPNATSEQVRDALYAATTKNIVTNSSTANNHLLYSPPTGFGTGVLPPPVNQAPVADFTVSCTYLVCSFSNTSTDDGTITSSWDFDDGNTSSSTNPPSHTYDAEGSYTITLTVTDDGDPALTNTKTMGVSVTEEILPPPPPPSDGATLTGSGSKSKGKYTVNIQWSGFVSATLFDIYRNGSLATIQTGHSWTDTGKGGGNLTYQVCATGSTTNCTNTITVSP
jgi:PKD repeat protein